MRIVFMGTPEMASQVLSSISSHHEIVGVYTMPDAVRGRGKRLTPSPVKKCAVDLDLDVYTPETLRDNGVLDKLASLKPDVICVVAYGALLPAKVLEIPKFGCLNVHTSLLPRWRGAAPIQRALLANDKETGVSIMKLDEGLDTGPYCIQAAVPIEELSLEQLESELATVGSECLLEALYQIENGTVQWFEQPNEGITYASKIQKSELLLDPADTALENVLRVRASSDAHPSRAIIAEKPLVVLKAKLTSDKESIDLVKNLISGEAIFVQKRLFLGASDGVFEIEYVKPDGKKAMDAKSFAIGLQGIKGKTFAWRKS